MNSAAVHRLEKLLRETRVSPLDRVALRSGLRGLDAVLGAGGLPLGQITEWVGPASAGKTALLRTLVQAVRRQGVPVAWVDGRGELLAGDWADAGAAAPLWVVRPPDEAEAAFCAEVLLRTQSFGLVVLDGGPPLSDTLGVRLQRLARQATAALVRLRTLDEPSGRLVRHRLAVQPEVPPAGETPLATRAPLVWPIRAHRARGGQPEAEALYLTEAQPDRLDAHQYGADRPTTRTRPGARYGIV